MDLDQTLQPLLEHRVMGQSVAAKLAKLVKVAFHGRPSFIPDEYKPDRTPWQDCGTPMRLMRRFPEGWKQSVADGERAGARVWDQTGMRCIEIHKTQRKDKGLAISR
ncbi:hypothetical protein [Pseudogemmobacter sp. W21_MBD1_M6]|uniref:hypothetical protein n=1 Tax=Pseudogemmobacter sp. W21_MBD1_M6 TaxID=3240271 RepID=UPI003F983D73